MILKGQFCPERCSLPVLARILRITPLEEFRERGSGFCYWWERSSATQGVEGLRVDVFPGVGGAELKQDAAHAEPHDGADFEQLQTDRLR